MKPLFVLLSAGLLGALHLHAQPFPAPATNLVWIPPGTFTMGSPTNEAGRNVGFTEDPQTQVTLTHGFWMAKYEVTQDEFLSVMNFNPSHFTNDLNRPVEQVSWDEAGEFCNRLTDRERAAGRVPTGYRYRLPTEAEWEYACRAGTTTIFSFGTNVADLDLYAWHLGNTGYTNNGVPTGTSQPVGLKLPNPWGLYDMHGNVGEFVLDWAGHYAGGSVTDPVGPPTGSTNIFRGPAWDFGDVNTRSASRWAYPRGWRDDSIGFRVVLAAAVCVPLPADAVAWWRGDGDATDSVGQHHGVLQNGTTFTPGIAGQAFSFDGVNDYVAIPPLDFSGGSAITIQAWIKPVSITANQYYEIVRQQGAVFPDWLLSFQEFGTVLSFGLFAGGTYAELDVPITASAFADGNWHHVAATYDGATKRVYRDGVEIGSAAQTGTIRFAGTVHAIGSAGAVSEIFNGLIDEVIFFNRALDANEVQRLYNARGAINCPTTIYSTGFEGVVGPEWSRTNISLTPIGGRRFLGDFSNEVVRLSLTDLPPHVSARVIFDLFILRSWDGNGESCCGPDVWSLREEGGRTLLQTTFSNTGDAANRQAYPGSFTQSSVPARTGAAEVNTLGFQYPSTGGAVRDAVYHISIPFNHAGDSLALLFAAARLQGLTNESWGLDNVTVQLSNDPVPAPADTFAVEPGAIWRYLDNGSNQGAGWVAPNFDDSTWASGPAELGYGDNNGTEQRPEATVVSYGPNANAKYITTYFRRSFVVSNVWSITNLTLGLMRDDGGIVYLNGTEVFRSAMPAGAVTYQTLANVTADTTNEWRYFTTTVNPGLLVEGTNVFAVEIHQVLANSSDISFDLYLTADRDACDPGFLTQTNAAGAFTFERDAAVLNEYAGAAVFNVRRIGGSAGTVTVVCRTVNGSAVAGQDFTAQNSTLTFADGETLKQITVPITNDTAPENDETFMLRLSSPTGGAALGGCTNLLVTILDDDGVIEFMQTNLVVPEINRFVSVPIRWTGSTNRSVSVTVQTFNGNAASGSDYIAFGGPLTFAPGQTLLTPTIEIRDDLAVEADETFSFTLSNPTGGAHLGANTNVTITILDNDVPGNAGRGANEYIETIVMQPDGKALIGGNATALNGDQRTGVTLFRVTTNGLRDGTFSSPTFDSALAKLALAPDGKVLAGGFFSMAAGQPRGRIARFNANGVIDLTFAPTNGANFGVTEVVALPDGRVLIGGDFTAFDGVTRGHVARLNTNGTLDTTFDPGASIDTPYFFALNVQTNGQVVIGGSFGTVQGQAKQMLARLNANGTIDPTFNQGQLGPDSTVNFINVLPDGKLLVGGWFGNYNGVPRKRVARLFADGALDPSFDPQWDPNVTTTWNAAQQSDGKIIVVGFQSSAGGLLPNYITRFLSSGQLDASFQIGPGANAPVTAVGVLPDDRVVIGGQFTVFNGFNRYRLAYLNADGSLPDDPVSWIQWPGASGGNDHWYAFTKRPNNWTNAEAEAVANRGHLASVNSAAEQSFLETTFLKGLNRIRPFWIGLNDVAREGSFAWSSGEPVSYSNWETGQPDNANGVEDFVALNWYYSWNGATAPYRYGAWNDVPPLGYVSQTVSGGDGPYFGLMETTNNPFVPVITQPPQNLVINGRSNAVFTVTATVANAAPLSYQWRFFGTNLSDATNSTLAFASVQPEQSGPYAVVISANGNSVTSSVVTLRAVWVFVTADGQRLSGSAYSHEGPSLVSLESVYPGGLIYYSLDGFTPPDFITGTAYTGPFVVSASATLRAATYRADFSGYIEESPVQLTIFPGFRLFASTAGGGTVGLNPASAFYARAAVVTLTATPAPNWTFLGWTGDAAGTNTLTTVTMTRDLRVQAMFGAPLNLVVVPPGSGSVDRAPNLPLYPYGWPVQLTAQPAAGNYLYLWGGASNPTNNPQIITFTTAARTVTGLFSNLPPGQVALTLGANGGGRIAGNPRGNRFSNGTVVTLTATPDAGQDFLGWTGDATGMGNPLALTLDTSKSVTANFTRLPRLAAARESSISGANTVVRLTVTGDIGERYAVIMTDDLETPWQPFITLTNQFGAAQTVDTGVTNRPQRFFRARTQP